MKNITTGNYRSYKDLVSVIHTYINADMAPILQQVAEDIHQTLFDFIKDNWYWDRPTTEYYDRTYEVINSITISKIKTVGGGREVSIYFDDSKINSNQGEAGKWDQHMSMDGSTSWGGMSIGEWVVQWMDMGQNSQFSSYSGIHFIKNITDNKKQFIAEINNLLQAKGYMCVVK